MKLYILRHGEAEPYYTSDAERQLTERGVVDVKALGKMLKQEEIYIDTAYVSPYIRTQQTCEYFKHSVDLDFPVQIAEALTPSGSVNDICEIISGFDSGSSVLFVSHQPLVSSLIASLVAGSSEDAYQYPMMPASFAEIEIEEVFSGCGSLKRLITPPYL